MSALCGLWPYVSLRIHVCTISFSLPLIFAYSTSYAQAIRKENRKKLKKKKSREKSTTICCQMVSGNRKTQPRKSWVSKNTLFSILFTEDWTFCWHIWWLFRGEAGKAKWDWTEVSFQFGKIVNNIFRISEFLDLSGSLEYSLITTN